MYVPADVDPSIVEQRIVEAGAVLPHQGFVTGWAALRWHGGYWFSGLTSSLSPRPVWLNAHIDDIREQSGFRVTSEELRHDWVTQRDGLRVVTPPCATLVEVRYAKSLKDAVRAIDMAAYSDLVSLAEVSRMVASQNRFTGIPLARAALPFADENSWSPPEVDMRLAWTLDAGLPRPLTNRPIFDHRGNLIGVPDLFDPVAGLVGEYEGALHLAGAQRAKDLDRESLFRSHRLEYVTMLAPDLRDSSNFVRRLRAAYGRSRFEPETTRTWTLRQPPWWTPRETVEQRRALSALDRERLLKYRLRVA